MNDGHGTASSLELGGAEETGVIEVLNIYSFISCSASRSLASLPGGMFFRK